MTHEELAATAAEVLAPLENWGYQCHGASVELVRSGRFGPCRVARGGGSGVGGQHSWLVMGDDCYDREATIVDATLWSYDKTVEGVWVGTYRDERHFPQGQGSIWEWGRPDTPTGKVIELTPREPWSEAARSFLDLLGPLDHEGWRVLAHAPVEGWPAGEIYDAMLESGFEGWIPIDRVGMLTDRNPGGLYLPVPEDGFLRDLAKELA